MATSTWIKEMRQAAGATHSSPSQLEIMKDAPQLPPDGAEAAPRAQHSPDAANATQGESGTNRSDLHAMKEAALLLYRMYSPPPVNEEYWRQHDNGMAEDEITYWEELTDDLARASRAFGGNQQIIDLLCRMYERIEAEYKQRRDAIIAEWRIPPRPPQT